MALQWLTEIELTSDNLKLVPLSIDHLHGLKHAASDGELWQLWFTSVPHPDNCKSYIENALLQQKEGTALPFAIIDAQSNTVIGSTRICHAQSAHRRVEIGYTWYAQSYQRTRANTECKLLLLTHAFETLNCIAVEFRTNWHNTKSRNAIARLGAKQDAVLRNHQILADGTIRDTVVFSIIENEWPAVKKSLTFKLQNHS
ncbi:MAG: GNAT family N-acetyltransferase [Gammaproteobacteria bacterium]|nr:GNAT family N-acetyltransferase [Gammaproteobacteria bacterium]